MASKHMVTCVECGRRFDVNAGGGYYNKSSRRYTCKKCGNQIKNANRKAQAKEREARTGMKQSMGAMIAKIAVGILFVIAGFSSPEGGWTFGYFLTALVVGVALIAWGLLPYLNAKKAKTIVEDVASADVEEETKEEVKVCKSCGASGTGLICEYCGKKF